MHDFFEGWEQVTGGIIGSVAFTAILSSFQESGLIPLDTVILFSAVGFAASLALLHTFVTAGIIFDIGWIVGASILWNVMSITERIVFLVAPILALVWKGVSSSQDQH